MATQLGHVLEIYHPGSEKVIAVKVGEYDEPQFTAKDGYAIPTGFFNKTIQVYGNAANSPLKRSILGSVK